MPPVRTVIGGVGGPVLLCCFKPKRSAPQPRAPLEAAGGAAGPAGAESQLAYSKQLV